MQMSTTKYASVQERLDAILSRYNIPDYKALSVFLGVKYQTLMAWKKRNSIGDYSAFLDKCRGLNLVWLKTGEGEMFQEEAEARPHGEKRGPVYIIDVPLLSSAIEAVELALEETGRSMPPHKKAELIGAIYELYADGGLEVDKQKVLRLVKTAV